MSVVSYRLYCTECSNETVVRRSGQDDTPWSIKSLTAHNGLCPNCNPAVSLAEIEDSEQYEHELAVTSLDHIGTKAGANLRQKGFDSIGAIRDATDEQLLDVPWVGEKALLSLREAANDLDPQKRWE